MVTVCMHACRHAEVEKRRHSDDQACMHADMRACRHGSRKTWTGVRTRKFGRSGMYACMQTCGSRETETFGRSDAPSPPTNITPTNIARLKLSGKFPMDMRIPPLGIKIVLESDPLKSIMLVGRLGVQRTTIYKQQIL